MPGFGRNTSRPIRTGHLVQHDLASRIGERRATALTCHIIRQSSLKLDSNTDCILTTRRGSRLSGALEVLARRLWRARTSGGQVPVTAASELASVEDAYRVQRAIEALASMPRLGWKVGATSEDAQWSLDSDGPVTAPMFAPFCFESPATVSVFPGQSASVECEFAFRFSRELQPRAADYSLREVMDAVGSLLPAIEVVGGRFEDGLGRIGQRRLVADMSAHTAFVQGRELTDWRAVDTKSHPVSLLRNGRVVREGIGSNALGDPLLVLLWTANHISRMGESIEAGQIVTTGTCTGITRVSHADNFGADFGSLGRVEVSVVEESI